MTLEDSVYDTTDDATHVIWHDVYSSAYDFMTRAVVGVVWDVYTFVSYTVESSVYVNIERYARDYDT